MSGHTISNLNLVDLGRLEVSNYSIGTIEMIKSPYKACIPLGDHFIDWETTGGPVPSLSITRSSVNMYTAARSYRFPLLMALYFERILGHANEVS